MVDEIDAQLTVTHLDASLETLRLAMPYATYDETAKKLTCAGDNVGIVPEEAYLKNVTMFAKVVGGGYKKITLYNAMSEADFTLTAAPKGEGEMPLEVYAHWDPMNDTQPLYEIEDVASIATGDIELPTVITTVPAHEADDFDVADSLTAKFSEDIQVRDINESNFTLIKRPMALLLITELCCVPYATFAGANLMQTKRIFDDRYVRDRAGNK